MAIHTDVFKVNGNRKVANMHKKRSELISIMCQKFPHLTEQEVTEYVKLCFNTIGEKIINGERIELRGFGAFSHRIRSNMTIRNPKTGIPIRLNPQRKVIYFRASQDLNNAVNNS